MFKLTGAGASQFAKVRNPSASIKHVCANRLLACREASKDERARFRGRGIQETDKDMLMKLSTTLACCPTPWQPTWPCLAHLRLGITKVRAPASEELIRLVKGRPRWTRALEGMTALL